MSERTNYEIDDYEILSVAPTNDFVAVYVDEGLDGQCDLIANRVDAIGLVRITRRYVEGVKGYHYDEEIDDPDTWTEIAGLELIDGTWERCEEACNFAGLMRVGDDISRFNSLIDKRYRDKLRKPLITGL